MSAIKKLLTEIVDYAGLFPPAKLPIEEVVMNHEAYLGSAHNWMLARLILPAGRLTELETQTPFLDSVHSWKISALVPSVDSLDAFETSMQTIEDFNKRHNASGRAVADTIEIKAGSIELIGQTIPRIPSDINAFLEVPHQEDPSALIAAVAKGGDNIFAKIRTGGLTADLIPPAEQVARFIACCVKHDVGFKATAGLHHPICGSYRLTYDKDSDSGSMFGFLNVFLAAAFAFEGAEEDFVTEVLKEKEIDSFDFQDNAIVWKGNSVSSDSIAKLRKSKAISFGSCSFTEPTEELVQPGLI